jgi:predicted O-methyltransferase YrrM
MIEYEKDAVVQPYITSYIHRELPPYEGILKELEEYAKAHEVPIVQPETARLISVLGKMMRPKKILEVGTAIGYSAILLSDGLAEGGHITTLEYSRESAELAKKNIERAGLSDTIEVVLGDGEKFIAESKEDGEYDYIFLDGPKSHYLWMLDDCVRLLRRGGILVADNVLYKGMTAEQSLVIRRKITIVKRLRKFITALEERGDLETAILSVGDGVTVSVKK